MRALYLFLLALLLTGCNVGSEADRATFDAIAPEYLSYVNGDQNLTDAQKARRRETVRSWEAKVRRADPDAPLALPGTTQDGDQ